MFTPLELMERLAAIIPKPRTHQIRFHGFLASNSKIRSLVATSRKKKKEVEDKKVRAGEIKKEDSVLTKAGKIKWAQLLKRVFNTDIEKCTECGGRLRILAAITKSADIKRILTHVGIDPNPPPVSPSKQLAFDW